jgi:TRAP-type transport system small permease protein
MPQPKEAVMTRVVDLYFTALKFLVALFLAVMVVLVFGNVFLRYAFNTGITVSEELSRWLFVWMTFLGALVALREHSHLGVDTLVKRLPPLGKKICLVLSLVLMLYVTWLLLQGSWEQTLINLDVKAPATGLSTGLFYGVGLVFGVTAAFILFHQLYRVVAGKASVEELVMVKESEEQAELEELQKQLAERDAADRAALAKK